MDNQETSLVDSHNCRSRCFLWLHGPRLMPYIQLNNDDSECQRIILSRIPLCIAYMA
jgi:hypothetical protein